MNKNIAKKTFSSEYSEALVRLLKRPTNPKLGLERMRSLLALIGFKKTCPIVQVVGTNGKGSTVAFIESIAMAHGMKTGLFVSPHLSCARERIRLDKNLISHEDFAHAADFVLDKAKNMTDEPSFFECVLAMALHVFDKHNVDLIILEAGLGGRLDATTAVQPDILGISMIDLDHQNILGATLDAIAREKMAAAYAHEKVISVRQKPEVVTALHDGAAQIQGDLMWSKPCLLALGLKGHHQRDNAGLAIDLLHHLGIKLEPKKLEEGLLLVSWPGRFEVIRLNEQEIILDGAHNPSGIEALIKTLQSQYDLSKTSLVLVYGSLKGPNAFIKTKLLAALAPSVKTLFVHSPNNPRAMLDDELRTACEEAGFSKQIIKTYTDWTAVMACAKMSGALILVCGSLYTVGHIRAEIMGLERDPEMPNF